jgi:hypothetical protein
MSFDPRIFQLLKSDDAEERKKGIKALARTGDREALRYLATIYKEDPEPDVRDLALKAGQHIKNTGTKDEWAGTGDFKATAEMAIPKAAVPEGDVKISKQMMEQALQLGMGSNFEKAEALVRKAFALNPNLQYESYFRGIATDVMGMEWEQAEKELLDEE